MPTLRSFILSCHSLKKCCRLIFALRKEILGLVNIKLGRKDVAKIGATTGLGSANNEKLADSGRRAFFDWISADDDIATARGGGGGLALWKRVPVDQED